MGVAALPREWIYTIEVEGKDYGSFWGTEAHAYGEWFYCSVCDRVWAKVEWPNRPVEWAHLVCYQHWDERSRWVPPGSIIPNLGTEACLRALPSELVLRELELTLAWADKLEQRE